MRIIRSRSFHAYSDSGHGWVKVKKEELMKWGIAYKISSYSYMKGDYAYLEEDCDATLFIETLKYNGIEAKLVHHFTDRQSKIRSYDQYSV